MTALDVIKAENYDTGCILLMSVPYPRKSEVRSVLGLIIDKLNCSLRRNQDNNIDLDVDKILSKRQLFSLWGRAIGHNLVLRLAASLHELYQGQNTIVQECNFQVPIEYGTGQTNKSDVLTKNNNWLLEITKKETSRSQTCALWNRRTSDNQNIKHISLTASHGNR
ncbi:hypothetical protein GJ496_003332 [Pomphorhynchus laevis]|nr:hypothetical protein GJ496_003332 [Pomphorhynchus laevis]